MTAPSANAERDESFLPRLRAYFDTTLLAEILDRGGQRPELWGWAAVTILSTLVLVSTTAVRPQALDYFSRLAEAFLHGRIWLNEAPSWLNELIPAGPGQWYVTYPPMPAVLAMPFVAVFGREFPAQVYSSIYGGLDAGLVFLLLGRLNMGLRIRDRLGLTVVFTFGTVFWYVAIGGSAWYFAHVSAVLFTLAALIVALDHRPAWIAGLLIGCAALSRLPAGFAALFVLAALLDFPARLKGLDLRRAARIAITFGIGLAVPAALYVLYNEVRWGTITDQGYVMIPGVLEDPVYAKHGILSIWYIPRNLFAILFRSWNYVDDAPFLQPSWWGLGIFLTTPLYLWMAKTRLRDPKVVWALLAAVLVSIPILTHGNVGFTQFGYRFSLDFQVLLFVVLASAIAVNGWSRRSVLAGALSIGFCGYAVWAISIGFVHF